LEAALSRLQITVPGQVRGAWGHLITARPSQL